MLTVLVVEDEENILKLVRATFTGNDTKLLMATTYEEFCDLLPGLSSSMVAFLDEDFSGGSGAQAAAVLRSSFPRAKLVSISARERERLPWNPDAFLQKPFSPAQVLATVKGLLLG
ncbi:MAG: response regulator [bacterium]|nr:response regulator [bacterium]